MTPRTFKGDVERNGAERARFIEGWHYALARSLCAWMDEQGKLWAFYRAWRDGFGDDEDGRKAFAQVMGGTPNELNATWTTWAR